MLGGERFTEIGMLLEYLRIVGEQVVLQVWVSIGCGKVHRVDSAFTPSTYPSFVCVQSKPFQHLQP